MGVFLEIIMEFQKTQSIRGKITDNRDSFYTMELYIE
jgi:hypothetical protein